MAICSLYNTVDIRRILHHIFHSVRYALVNIFCHHKVALGNRIIKINKKVQILNILLAAAKISFILLFSLLAAILSHEGTAS